jgi:hypothetical protein
MAFCNWKFKEWTDACWMQSFRGWYSRLLRALLELQQNKEKQSPNSRWTPHTEFRKRKNIGSRNSVWWGSKRSVQDWVSREGAKPKSLNSFAVVTLNQAKEQISARGPPTGIQSNRTERRACPAEVPVSASILLSPYGLLQPDSSAVGSHQYALKGDKPQRHDVCRF